MTTHLIEINGSYGRFSVHALSGHIADRNHSAEYEDIVWFDPNRLKSNDMDICGTAFVTTAGRYYRECIEVDESWHFNTLLLEMHRPDLSLVDYVDPTGP